MTPNLYLQPRNKLQPPLRFWSGWALGQHPNGSLPAWMVGPESD
jgi:hypothetical protein